MKRDCNMKERIKKEREDENGTRWISNLKKKKKKKREEEKVESLLRWRETFWK